MGKQTSGAFPFLLLSDWRHERETYKTNEPQWRATIPPLWCLLFFWVCQWENEKKNIWWSRHIGDILFHFSPTLFFFFFLLVGSLHLFSAFPVCVACYTPLSPLEFKNVDLLCFYIYYPLWAFWYKSQDTHEILFNNNKMENKKRNNPSWPLNG